MRTMAKIITTWAVSPRMPVITAAISRIITKGLLKCDKNSINALCSCPRANSLRPYFSRRLCASWELSPATEVSKRARRFSIGRLRISSELNVDCRGEASLFSASSEPYSALNGNLTPETCLKTKSALILFLQSIKSMLIGIFEGRSQRAPYFLTL